MPTAPTTVATARFEDLVSRGLRALIEEDPALSLVAHGIEHSALPRLLERDRPSVAILNFGSLRHSGEVAELHARWPETRLLILANRPSPAECNQMLAFGATACLSKETQARDVLNAIHLASRGLHVLPRQPQELRQENGPDLLTRREADVLELLQLGYTNARIAEELHVGMETVRTHARAIYRKLGIQSRRDLASLFGTVRVR